MSAFYYHKHLWYFIPLGLWHLHSAAVMGETFQHHKHVYILIYHIIYIYPILHVTCTLPAVVGEICFTITGVLTPLSHFTESRILTSFCRRCRWNIPRAQACILFYHILCSPSWGQLCIKIRESIKIIRRGTQRVVNLLQLLQSQNILL